MTIARYNLIAKTLRETFLLLPLALLASKGTRVEVTKLVGKYNLEVGKKFKP